MKLNNLKIGVLASVLPFLLMPSLNAEAQYLQDVIKVAQPDYGSTARFKAMGNAQTSLGGDLTAIGGNPAGLGFFNQSDISFSLDFLSDHNDVTYFGNNNLNSLNKLGLNQAALVFHTPSRRARGSNLTTGWLNFNFGVGYHKTNNFNSTLGYSGINTSSTFSHFLSDQADAGLIEGDLGWESFMVDYNGSNPQNTYHYPAVLEQDNAQKNVLTDKGIQSTTNFAFGANYSNKLYLGASVGFTHYNFTTQQMFAEDGYTKSYDDIYRENPNSDFLDSSQDAFQLLEAEYSTEYNFSQTTKGNGVNATLGIIYKPIPNVNIGLSATTPTWNMVTDESSLFLDTWYYDNPQASDPFFSYNSEEIEDYIEYTIRTPYRISGGVSTVFGMGLISVDLEYTDYSSMHFSASDQLGLSLKQDLDRRMNDGIKSTYTSAVNFRAGGEYFFTENLLGRIGYSHRGSPYKDSELTTETVSGGLGYRINNMYLDLSYQHFNQSYISNPYTIDTGFWEGYSNPQADVTHTRHQVFMTIGFKF